MKIKGHLSGERVAKSLKSLGKLRVKTNRSSMMTFSALILILFIAFTVRVLPIRWEIQTGSIHLSEFDPYFQFRFTEYMVNHGFFSWVNPEWIDTQRWYPDGINVAQAGFPGLPFTAAFLYNIVSVLGVNVALMDFCALLPPIMGMLACLVIYFLGKDLGGKSLGLFASLFLALTPSYIQRTSLGFFDDEIIGILALLLFVTMFLRSIEETKPITSSLQYALGSGVALGYFCSGWGAAYYPIGVTLLFVFTLMLIKRYSQRLFLSFSLTFGLGLFLAINVPKLSSGYLLTMAILPVVGIFVLLCLFEVFQAAKSQKWKFILILVFLALLSTGFFMFWQLGYMRDIAGKFISVLNPFTRAASPLIESVAEHRISAWGSIYYEFGIGIFFFIAGLFFVLRNLNNKNLFLLIFGLTSLYFASSMVRLLVLMAPAFSLMAGLGIAGTLKPFKTLLQEQRKGVKKRGLGHVGKEFSGAATLILFVVLMTNFAFPMPKVYSQAISPITITAGGLPFIPNEPVREWLDMLQYLNNLPQSSTFVVCSWWDYGYWLTVLGNVTSLVDNATINGTQIENVGFIFMANETQSLQMLERYGAKYILVFTTFYAVESQMGPAGTWAGYGDEGKWMWMARISGQSPYASEWGWSDEKAFGGFNNETNAWEWNNHGMNSTIYTLMSYAKDIWCVSNYISNPDIPRYPLYFKEEFFAGLDLSQSDAYYKYNGIVPLVCLYRIDWEKYYSDYPNQ